MSGRGVMHNQYGIWTGEKFGDFMNSNADVFVIMIGTNDNFVKFEKDNRMPDPKTWNETVRWNSPEAIDEFINTYLELVTKIRALPQKP